jgi:ribosomal protein L19
MDTSNQPAPVDGSLHTIITNSLQFHMNEVSTIVPDERDFVRTWRRRLRDVLNNEKHVFTQFLSPDVNNVEVVKRHNQLLRELGDTLFNPRSEWVRANIHPIVSTNDILSEIAHDIEMPINVLQRGLHATLMQYTSTIHALFECEERLERKIKVIEIDRIEAKLKYNSLRRMKLYYID